MALNNRKILDTDVTTKGVVAAPNILKGSAQQNKAIFDRLIREIVKERLNALIDDLTAVTAAGELGASVEGVTGNTVQAVLSALKAEVDTKAGEAGVTAKLALKADRADTDLHFKAIGFDAATGTFTFTRENGTSVEVDTALEKVAVNFTYDATTEELVLTLADGSTQRISLAALISTFDFVDSSTVAFGVSGGTVTAQVKAGSITDEMLSTALVDYLEGLVSDAESSEIAAGSSAQSAASAAASASSSASSAASAAASASSSASSAASARSSASFAASVASSGANRAAAAADAAENSSNVAARAAASAAVSAASASGAVTRYPYIDGESGNWMVWDTSQGAFVNSGVHATGADGEDGKDGADGQPGADGAPGKSAYASALDGGYTGTEAEFNRDLAEVSDKVSDVQINGTSIVTDGVANVPFATENRLGVTKLNANFGLSVTANGSAYVASSNSANIKSGDGEFRPIAPVRQHESTFYGLAKAAGSDEKNSTLPVGQYTESAKSAISTMLNGSVTVTGATPTINALSGVSYVCGEVSTLDIVLPASGIVDVTFESGATATVLTVTPPTGVTMKWANDFDPTSLEANTTYEINIMDGIGVAVGVSA